MSTLWKGSLTCILSVFALCLAVPALAQEVEPMVKQTSDDVSFITGGIGLGERAELKELFKKEYTCRIEIANKKLEYLYKARICILDANGDEVLETDTCGPWLLVDLEAGSYTAVIKHRDETKEVKFAVTAGKKPVVVAIF